MMNRASKTAVLALATTVAMGCSINARAPEPRETNGADVAAGTVPVAGPNALACSLDTRVVVEHVGHFIEVITSRGRLFELDNGVPIQTTMGIPAPAFSWGGAGGAPSTGLDLSSVPLYAQGPCFGAPPLACVFDTHAFVRLPEGRLLEYVTANGRQWVFENNQMTGAGVPLTAIPRYQQICGPIAAMGQACVFDTRVFVKIGAEIVESITAYGRRWELSLDGLPLPNTGLDLTASPRYANGPCQGFSPGTCILETRSFEPGPNGQLVESVTSRGLVFTYSADTGAELQPATPLAARPQWANGPCL